MPDHENLDRETLLQRIRECRKIDRAGQAQQNQQATFAKLRQGKRFEFRFGEICLKKMEDTSYDEYVGSGADLIAAGIVKPEQLPGQPGNGKICTTFYKGVRVMRRSRCPGDEGYLRITRANEKSQRFTVRTGLSDEERDRRSAEQDRREDALLSAEQLRIATEEAESDLANMPKSHQEYRRRSAISLMTSLRRFRDSEMGPSDYHGYRFHEETIEEFNVLADQLLSLLVDGRTEFDAGRHAKFVATVRADVAMADMPLQEFISGTVAQAVIDQHRTQQS
jgi:hypothetical protein